MKKLVILSGGLDSTILTHYVGHQHGFKNLEAITFDYGQKQYKEIEQAIKTCSILSIPHKIVDMTFLKEMLKDVSANIQGSKIAVPKIKDVLGDPQPVTYVPYRNMIMTSVAFSFAEAIEADTIFSGLQIHDEYGYWDTTEAFISRINDISSLNRKHQIALECPFSSMSKRDELVLASNLGILKYLKYTLTCYNPSINGVSCAACPSCSERIHAFKSLGLKDPIEYAKDIDWGVP
jgi:7-cyano-7-deazaguanine synthase